MSKFPGGQEAYPVYLTIGNISKRLRRMASTHTTVILGYLLVDRFKDVADDAKRKVLRGTLLHQAMHAIMEPLEAAGETGVAMWCADGHERRIYLLMAAFVGDWPEQNDMACTVQSGCPVCTKKPRGRGDGDRAPTHPQSDTLRALDSYRQTGRPGDLHPLGLRPLWPWWANLPTVTFGQCITPDLLHQLHKGMVEHAIEWVQTMVGTKVIDDRYASMTHAHGLRHFKRGISTVSHWTGSELKEMAKQLLPIMAEDTRIPDTLCELVQALLDFSFIAHAARLTEKDIDELEEALATVHRLKEVLISPRIYQGAWRFDNIPKLHMLSHYADAICEHGTPDGYNSEAPEYLHIVYVKRGWAASNKRDAIPQIIQFCQRLEALRIHRTHLDEYYDTWDRPPSGNPKPHCVA